MTDTTTIAARGRGRPRTHTRLDWSQLQRAVKVAMAQRVRDTDGKPFTAADVGREAGLDEPAMSALLKHGGPLGMEELFLLLAWLHVDPAMFRLDEPVPVPAPRKAA